MLRPILGWAEFQWSGWHTTGCQWLAWIAQLQGNERHASRSPSNSAKEWEWEWNCLLQIERLWRQPLAATELRWVELSWVKVVSLDPSCCFVLFCLECSLAYKLKQRRRRRRRRLDDTITLDCEKHFHSHSKFTCFYLLFISTLTSALWFFTCNLKLKIDSSPVGLIRRKKKKKHPARKIMIRLTNQSKLHKIQSLAAARDTHTHK